MCSADCIDEGCLGRGMYLVEMMHRCWFFHELLYALVESAIKQQIWGGMLGCGQTLRVERRPNFRKHAGASKLI
jgi:hypothetical protein